VVRIPVPGTQGLAIERAPTGSRWQLGPLPPERGCIALIRWDVEPRAVDGGLPDQLVQVLAQTLCAAGRVVGLVPRTARVDPGRWVDVSPNEQVLVSRGHLVKRVKRALTGCEPRAWCATTHPDGVVRLLNDPGWTLQGQIVLVFPMVAPLPSLPDADDANADLLSDRWADAVSLLGPLYALRPGVDGAVAGLWSPTEAARVQLVAMLTERARAAGIRVT
jgi:hypothetical protein